MSVNVIVVPVWLPVFVIQGRHIKNGRRVLVIWVVPLNDEKLSASRQSPRLGNIELARSRIKIMEPTGIKIRRNTSQVDVGISQGDVAACERNTRAIRYPTK